MVCVYSFPTICLLPTIARYLNVCKHIYIYYKTRMNERRRGGAGRWVWTPSTVDAVAPGTHHVVIAPKAYITPQSGWQKGRWSYSCSPLTYGPERRLTTPYTAATLVNTAPAASASRRSDCMTSNPAPSYLSTEKKKKGGCMCGGGDGETTNPPPNRQLRGNV